MKLGDHVVLVDDDWSTSVSGYIRLGKVERPVKGRVYTVAETRIAAGEPHITLAEIQPEPQTRDRRTGWFVKRFRKLDRLTPEKILAIDTIDIFYSPEWIARRTKA